MAEMWYVAVVLLLIGGFRPQLNAVFKELSKKNRARETEEAIDEGIAAVDSRFADQPESVGQNAAVTFFANDLEENAVKSKRRLFSRRSRKPQQRSLDQRIEPTLDDLEDAAYPSASPMSFSAYGAVSDRSGESNGVNPESNGPADDIIPQQSFDAPNPDDVEQAYQALIHEINQREEAKQSKSEDDADNPSSAAKPRNRRNRGGGHKYL